MKKITKGIKLRCYPNTKQRRALPQMFGNSRRVWNYMLTLQQYCYRHNKDNDDFKSHLSTFDMTILLTKIKKKKRFSYLKSSDASALQVECENLTKAYNRFFKHQGGFPKYKNRKNEESYTCKDSRGMSFTNNDTLRLSRLGKVHTQPCKIEGKIKRATVIKTSRDKYFVSLTVETEVDEFNSTEKAVGIDLGLRNIINLSNGRKYKSLHFKQLDRELAEWQRKYAKRVSIAKDIIKYEANKKAKDPFWRIGEDYHNLPWWERRGVVEARNRVKKLYEKQANKRKDYLQKISTDLIKNFDVIAVENLNIAGMRKNRKFSKAISEQGWAMFVNMLEYKAAWYGKTLVKVNPAGTTQTCSYCGHINKGNDSLTVDVEEWNCPNCGVYHDRDRNAAMNILDRGLDQLNKK